MLFSLFYISSSGISESIEHSYRLETYGTSFPVSELSPMDCTQYVNVNSENSCTEYKINPTMNATLQTYETRRLSPEGDDVYVEGCVAEGRTGFLYIVEKDVGLWRYDLKLDKPRVERLIAHVGDWKLLDDPKGITLVVGQGEDLGYLFVSHPAISVFTVYERARLNKYIMSFSISKYQRTRKDRSVLKEYGYPEDFDTFGIAAIGNKLNEDFPCGLHIAQDDLNDFQFSRALKRTSFRLESLKDILGEERANSLGCA